MWITCGLLCCFYQLFGLSFWRHPFPAGHPLVSTWCDGKFQSMMPEYEYVSSMAWGLVQCQQISIFWVNYFSKDGLSCLIITHKPFHKPSLTDCKKKKTFPWLNWKINLLTLPLTCQMKLIAIKTSFEEDAVHLTSVTWILEKHARHYVSH